MTDTLARIIVRETHGIRRFLYPLKVEVLIPEDIDIGSPGFADSTGEAVPFMLLLANANVEPLIYTLDFAPSLAPFEERELLLTLGGPRAEFGDLLNLAKSGRLGWKTQQRRFSLETDWDNIIDCVTYDGIAHLRGKSSITRNGYEFLIGTQFMHNSKLRMQAGSRGMYPPDGCFADTTLDVTACKSWATVTHTVQQPKAGDVITFTLPLTATALPLLCDFGIGGGVYGKIGAGDTVTWETKFGYGPVQWTLSTNGRIDYAGTVATREEYRAQQWFHVLDKGKALAVALTHVPDNCRTLTVMLNSEGDVQIAFALGDSEDKHAEFGVCYHFLNDAPAIAAATNPQSILLPPTVEVIEAPPPQ